MPAATEVVLAVSDGSASGADYTATGATLTIATGAAQGTATVTLTPVDDRLDEGNETVEVGGTAGTLAVAPAPVTITDNDDRGVTVTPTELSVPEGDSGTYTVALDTQPTADVTVRMMTDLTGTDVTVSAVSPDTLPLRFTPESWNRPRMITVDAAHDDDTADAEVKLSHAASGGDYGGETAEVAVTIVDDDVEVSFGAASYAVTEGASVTVMVRLSEAPGRQVEIPLTKQNQGGAVDGDYTGVATSLTFGSADTEQSFTIAAVDDAVDDDGESVELSFGAALPAGVLAGAPAAATVALTDNDAAPTGVRLRVMPASVNEDAGATELTVTAELQGGSTLPAATEVVLAVSGGSATAGADYAATGATLTIAAGAAQGTATVTLTPVDDRLDEGERDRPGRRHGRHAGGGAGAGHHHRRRRARGDGDAGGADGCGGGTAGPTRWR